MPSGVMRLRHSRSAAKTMPRAHHGITDISGLRGTEYKSVMVDQYKSVMVDPNVGSNLAPQKHRPFRDYQVVGAPSANTDGVSREGVIRGRQADKSSRGKK